ncbi:MAG: hypothetical protein P1U86_19780 [Verrucomicrobiales bacterium]|nr:hypothetical protein [Verrucomicrobiales bacterium]
MKCLRERRYRESGLSMGNMLTVLAIAGSIYFARGQFTSANLQGQVASQVVRGLGQPVAKEFIPRPG